MSMNPCDSDICFTCMQSFVKDNPFVACTKCSNFYHAGKCSGVTKTTLKAFTDTERDSWVCSTCNLNKSRTHQTPSASEPSLSAILQEIMKNGQKMSSLMEKMESLETKMNVLSNKHDELALHVERNTTALEEVTKHVSALDASDKTHTIEIQQLSTQINDLEQYTRRNNVEIRGLPLQDGEDLLKTVNEVAVKLQLPPLSEADYDAVHRLPSKSKEQAPPIIIKFKSRQTRDKWLGQKNKLKSPLERGSPVFLCENLTALNKKLLWQCRSVAKDKGYQYVWVRNGRIFVRREDGTKAVQIKHINDLATL